MSYDRFTLRVSWPASVSPPPHTQYQYVFTEQVSSLFSKKISIPTGCAQLASPRPIVCSSLLRPHRHHGTPAPLSCADPSRAGGHPYSAARAQGGRGGAAGRAPRPPCYPLVTLLGVLLMSAISAVIVRFGDCKLGMLAERKEKESVD